MTDMKRTTVSLSDELVEELGKLRATKMFKKCTFSEMIRQCISLGLPTAMELANDEKGAQASVSGTREGVKGK